MNQCPLTEVYVFDGACRVTTCKMYTECTTRKCMILDTNFAAYDKNVSDAELVRLKFPNMSVRDVSSLRKRAVARVQAVTALYTLLHTIRNSERPEHGFNSAMQDQLSEDNRKLIKKALRSKIFRLPVLEFEVWMLGYVLDRNYVEKKAPGFERFSFHLLLKLAPKEFESITTAITEIRKQHHG